MGSDIRIDVIRENIASFMNNSCFQLWLGVLEDTTPGHYGVEDISFDIRINDIWVDIPKRSFIFQNGTLSFTARLGGSRDGIDMPVEVTISGSGSFEFAGGSEVEVVEINVPEEIHLINDDS